MLPEPMSGHTKPKSVEEVNDMLEAAGINSRLVRACVGTSSPYYYFENLLGHGIPSRPIEVSTVSDYSLDQWLSEAKIREAFEKSNPEWAD
jgi:hypothetical protein